MSVLNSTIPRELQILHVIIGTGLFLEHYSSRPFTVLHSQHITNIHTPHCRAALQASVYTTPHLNPNILHLRPVPPIMDISPISAPPNVAEETVTNLITSHTLAYKQEDIERRHTIRKMKSSSNLHDIFRRGEGGCRRGPTSQVRSAASYTSL